jgi:hypothetical protein
MIRDLADPVALGVHPAAPLDVGDRARAPEFITRDGTPELIEALLRSRFVVLSGESTAGKSRAAYEAMRAELADHRLVEPVGRHGVQEAVDTATRHPGAVLWLDDIERFLGRDGLTSAGVSSVLSAPGRARYIIATIRAEEHARFGARASGSSENWTGEALRESRQVLNMATCLNLPRAWSHNELARAAEHRGDLRIADALDHSQRFGLAEYLAAGPQLLADWRNAWEPGTHVRGAALVLAAVDARRVGIHRPLPLQVLEEIHGHYLDRRGGSLLRAEPLDAAMAWATSPLHATSSLLIPAEDSGFLAFDYLIDSIAREPIPEPVLDTLIAFASPAEALDLAETARHWNRLEQAEKAFARAAASGEYKALSGRYYVIADREGDGAAQQFGRRLLDEQTATSGPDHPKVLRLKNLLILEHVEFADRETRARRALPEMYDLHAIAARTLGAEHEDTLEIRYSIVHLTDRAGEIGEAAQLARDLLADCERILGPNHQMTRRFRWINADLIGKAGDRELAVSLFKQMVADFESTPGDRFNPRLWVTHGYARSLTEAGRHEDAVSTWSSLIAELRKSRGELHNDTLVARWECAEAIGRGGDPQQALGSLRQLIVDASATHDQTSGLMLMIRREAARWTGEAGDPQEAVRELQSLIEIGTSRWGAAESVVVETRRWLDEWSERAAQHE